MAALSAVQRRNHLPEEEHSLEYLIFGKFHNNAEDLSGYVTTAWTPLSMLEEAANAPKLMQSIRSFVEASYQTFLEQFGSNPTVSAQVEAAVSSVKRSDRKRARHVAAQQNSPSDTSASPQTSEASEEEAEGECEGDKSLPEG